MSNTSTTADSDQLEAWKEVHGELTKAVLVARESLQAKTLQRRFWMETLCANLGEDGKLTTRSTWQRPTQLDLKKFHKQLSRTAGAKAAAKAAASIKHKSTASSVLKGRKRKAGGGSVSSGKPKGLAVKKAAPSVKAPPKKKAEVKKVEKKPHQGFRLLELNEDSSESDLSESDTNIMAAAAAQESGSEDVEDSSSSSSSSVVSAVVEDDDESSHASMEVDVDEEQQLQQPTTFSAAPAEHPYMAAARASFAEAGAATATSSEQPQEQEIYSTFNASGSGDAGDAATNESSESEDPF